jgi:hypothetical protein
MRNTKWAMLGSTALLAALVICTAVAASPDALSGTWKMNPGKSKFSPGPAQKSLTLVVESDENGIKLEATGVDGADKPMNIKYSAKYDGKDYPATGLPNADTISAKRIDANTIETQQKKDGKVIMTVTSKISKDGKTRTATFIGKDAEGHAVHNVVVYDKQ